LSFKEYIGSLQTSLLTILSSSLPFKDVWREFFPADQAALAVYSNAVPSGEVWEVNSVYGRTNGAVPASIEIYTTVTQGRLGYKADAFEGLFWIGSVLLEEGERILVAGNTIREATIRGVKRYSPEALEELLHKIRPIPLERDVQSGRPRPDPVM
jgi:hypothetical protein